MNKILVIANTKGGVGKSLISNHVATALMGNFKLLEIDNNNESNIFYDSKIITRENFVSLKLKAAEDELQKLIFELIQGEQKNVIIDCGGGNDSIEVLNLIQSLDLERLADTTYIVPVGAGKKQTKNAENTVQMLRDKDVVLCLNQALSLEESEVKRQFKFLFGDGELGIVGMFSSMGIIPYFAIPNSFVFEIAEEQGKTIYDLADSAISLPSVAEAQKLFGTVHSNFADFQKSMANWKLSKEALKILETSIFPLRKLLRIEEGGKDD